MKTLRFFIFLLIIFGFTMLSIYMAEKTDVLGLRQMELAASFQKMDGGRMVLSWERLPYPCFYKV